MAFFENIFYGNLYVDKVLIEYEDYSYSVLIDNKNNYYLCYCYEVDNNQEWLLTKVSINDLIDFLKDKVDIKKSFLNEKYEKLIVIRNYETEEEVNRVVSIMDVEKMDILPNDGIFLDIKDSINAYIVEKENLLFFNEFDKKEEKKISYCKILSIHSVFFNNDLALSSYNDSYKVNVENYVTNVNFVYDDNNIFVECYK